MKDKANSHLGYYGPEWDKKIQDKDNPNFWKYGVANLVFLDLIKERKRILDIGCGTGGSTLFLAEQHQSDFIIGVDPARSMVYVAKQHTLQRSLSHKVDFIVCDGMRLPFKQSFFDALVSRGDAFVFLVPQGTVLREFKRVLKDDAVVVIEIDNVCWKPGRIISYGFERMIDGNVAYFVEHFDARRTHVKVFYVLHPQGTILRKIRKDREFVQKRKLKRRFPLKVIRKETVEIRRGAVTHWPSIDEMKTLFKRGGFKDLEILGNGLLMGWLEEGDSEITKAMKKQPQLFFEIERKLIPFIDPKKAHTIILKAVSR